jgi:hypothetical protein
VIRRTIKTTRKMKNRILAIPAAATAIPVNPKRAAMIDTIKKIIAHLSIMLLHEVEYGISRPPRSDPNKKQSGSSTGRPFPKSLSLINSTYVFPF